MHHAARRYLRAGTLPQPISRYATSSGFRGIQDQVLSYRVAGSFVLHMTERFGLPPVLQFFQRVNNREESLDTIRARVQAVKSLDARDLENLDRRRQPLRLGVANAGGG